MMSKDTAFAFDRQAADPEQAQDVRGPMTCRFCGEDCHEDDWNDATARYTCCHCSDERQDARIQDWEAGR